MKKTLVFGAVVLLAAAAVAAGLLVWTQRGLSTASMSPSDAAVELRRALETTERPMVADTSAARAERAIAQRSEPNAPWWDRPLSEVFDHMKTAAETGDLQAAYALGSRSAQCMNVLRKHDPEALLSEYRQDREFIDVADDAELTQVRLRNTNSRFQRQLDAYEDCAVLGEERLSGHLSWLERAGHAGVAGARLAFVQYTMSEYRDDRGALIAEIEVARDRRTQARAWLEQLIRDGDEQGLVTYVEALSGGDGIYTADLAKSMAYTYALELVRSRRMGISARNGIDQFPKLWADGPIRYGDQLTPRQWDEITLRGRQIFQENFASPPLSR